MNRIAIIGSGGSGKSTLARQLGRTLGLPVIHLDALFWRPGWVETPRDEWEVLQRTLIAAERWFLDGNYGGTMEIRLRAADTVIYLDLPRFVCLRAAVWRSLRGFGRTRADVAPGCPEKLDLTFYRWIWEYPATRRPKILARLARLPAATRVIRLRSRRDLCRFVNSLTPGSRV